MTKPKSKIICIRLGDAEYRDIKRRCNELGLITVSDFVRAAMLQALGVPNAVASLSLEVRLAEYQRRIDRLQSRLEILLRNSESDIALP